jgi:hypothetical protein
MRRRLLCDGLGRSEESITETGFVPAQPEPARGVAVDPVDDANDDHDG